MLLIDNKKINVDLYDVLQKIHSINPSYLRIRKRAGVNIMCTCPFHGGHNEKHPSCGVNNDRNSKIFGKFHCFTCGKVGTFPDLVAQCFETSVEKAKNWLIENYYSIDNDLFSELDLPLIDLKESKKVYISEKQLTNFESFHPYMLKRKLSKEVIDKFEVKYDPKTECLVFPVRDLSGNITMFTRRSVKDKTFIIDREKEKPLYLLYDIIKSNVDTCMITEGQIDALTAWTYGFPCCATMGRPSPNQIKLLNNSGIRVLYTMFDNDYWGEQFTNMVNNIIRKDIIVINVKIPFKNKKDVNDLSREEFYKCLEDSKNKI